MKNSSSQTFLTRNTALMLMIFLVACSLLPHTIYADLKQAGDNASLSNDQLIDNLNNTYQRSYKKLQNELRKLGHLERELEENAGKLAKLPLNELKGSLAKKEVNTAYLKILEDLTEQYQKQLLLLETKKSTIAQIIFQADLCQSELMRFSSAMEEISPLVFEVQLRLTDKTITQEEVARKINLNDFHSFQESVKKITEQIATKKKFYIDSLPSLDQARDEAEKNLYDAQFNYKIFSSRYAGQIKQESLLKEYAKNAGTELTSEFNKVDEEKNFLNDHFHKLYDKFKEVQESIKKVDATLEGLTVTDINKISTNELLNLNQVELFYGQTKTNISTLSARIEQIDKKRDLIREILQISNNMIEITDGLIDKLIRMNVITSINAKLSPKKEDAQNKLALEGSIENVYRISSLITIEKNKHDHSSDKLIKILEESKSHLENNKLAHGKLERYRKYALAINETSQDLQKKKNEDILSTIAEKKSDLKKGMAAIKENYKNLATTETKLNKVYSALITVTSPLEQNLYARHGSDRDNIAGKVYDTLGIEPPKAENQTALSASALPSTEKDKRNYLVNSVDYQNTLYRQINYFDVYEKQYTEMAKLLEGYNKQLDDLVFALFDYHKDYKIYFLHNNEAGKRVLTVEDHANDSSIINNDILNTINDKINDLLTKQKVTNGLLSFEKENLERFTQMKSYVKKILDKVSAKIDTETDNLKLNTDFQMPLENLPESEKKSIQHDAHKRLNQEDSSRESLLNTIPSEIAKNLTNLMEDYYAKLINFEKKKINLAAQKENVDKLIRVAVDEKEKSLVLLNELDHARQQVIVIRKKLVTWINEQFANPATTEHKTSYQTPEMVEHLVTKSFKIYMELLTLDEWKNLMNYKLSNYGIDLDITQYNDQQIDLAAKQYNVERKIATIHGSEDSDIAKVRRERLKILSQEVVFVIIKIVSTLTMTLLLLFAEKKFVEHVYRRGLEEGSTYTHMLVPFLRVTIRFFIGFTTISIIMKTFGFDIGALVAGLGIGGLAIAMAAKSTLSDIISGLTILIATPFKVGDIIQFKQQWGTVKELGIRYTKVQDFSSNHMITIPNSMLSEAEITNVSSHPGFAVATNIRLSLRNTEKQVRKAVEIIENIIRSHRGARFIWVKHDHFDDYSYVLRMAYDVLEFKNRNKVENDINLEIVKQFGEHTIELTTPPGQIF